MSKTVTLTMPDPDADPRVPYELKFGDIGSFASKVHVIVPVNLQVASVDKIVLKRSTSSMPGWLLASSIEILDGQVRITYGTHDDQFLVPNSNIAGIEK